MKNNKKGFTIVELVIVIAVIAILAAVLIPTFSGVVSKANTSAALQTARSTLTNALNMSSNASLQGTTKSTTGTAGQTVEKTVILVDGYAFKYTGNQLESMDYPAAGGTVGELTMGATSTNEKNFNAICIAAENLKATTDSTTKFELDGTIAEIIKATTNLDTITSITLNNSNYYVNLSGTNYDAVIFTNTDLSKKAVVLTTFGAIASPQ